MILRPHWRHQGTDHNDQNGGANRPSPNSVADLTTASPFGLQALWLGQKLV